MSQAHDPGGHHGHGPVGPLVDEAALLLTAVEDKLQAWQAADGGGAGPAADLPQPCPECGTVPGAACTGCPVCRLIAAVRGERPEVTARMVDGALTIVRALRTLLPDPAAAPTGSRTADGPASWRASDGPPDSDPHSDPDSDPGGPDGAPAARTPPGPGVDPVADPAASGPTPVHDVGHRPGPPAPPRAAPRPSRPAGLQRIDIS